MLKPWLLSCALIGLLLFSCDSSNQKVTEVATTDTVDLSLIDLAEELSIDSGQAKMFTMPTPLQMASALKVMDVSYSSHLLVDDKLTLSNSDIDLSLALGMYMVDLGYSTVYGNTQKSLDYAASIQGIMEELPISYYVNDAFRKRFKGNINKHDSLCKIVLQGFSDANQYMAENGNEGIGLLILTGAYVEGFYLVANAEVGARWDPEYVNILIQQKLFLDNFLTLLKPYRVDGRINRVYDKLRTLARLFDGLDIYYNDEAQSYQLKGRLSKEKRDFITSGISELRAELVEEIKG